MRATNGRLLLAENGCSRISVITFNGEKASVTVIKEGLKTPTAVRPAGDTIWIAEGSTGKGIVDSDAEITESTRKVSAPWNA
jgi:hypothetical protein